MPVNIILNNFFYKLRPTVKKIMFKFRLLQYFYQDIDIHVKEGPMSPLKAKFNIQSFLCSAGEIGIKQFEVSDLFSLSNKNKVIESIMDLKTKVLIVIEY